MKCLYCESEIAPNAKFCPGCGASVNTGFNAGNTYYSGNNSTPNVNLILLAIGGVLTALCLVATIVFFVQGMDYCADKWNRVKLDYFSAWAYFFIWFLPFSLYLLGRAFFLCLKPKDESTTTESFLRTFGILHICILAGLLAGAIVMECIPQNLIGSRYWDQHYNNHHDYKSVFRDTDFD